MLGERLADGAVGAARPRAPLRRDFRRSGQPPATPRRYVAVLRPILEPASFTAADGSVYVMEGGSFVEQ